MPNGGSKICEKCPIRSRTEIHGAIENLPGSLPARQMLMRHAVEQLDALAAESADNPALQDELAQAYFNSAQLPDMPLAEKDLTLKKSIAIYQNLLAADQKNIHYQEQTALAEISLGDITKVRGSIAGAVELTERAVAALEQISASEPENEPRLVNLADAYEAIITLNILKGNVAAASQLTEKELTIIERIRRLKADEPALKTLYDVARIRKGTEQMLAGDAPSAIITLSQILAEYETAHTKTPNDTAVTYYLCVVNRRLAEALDKNGDVKAAAEHFRKALTIIEDLLESSPKDFGYHRNSAATHIFVRKIFNQAETIRCRARKFSPRRRIEQLRAGKRHGKQRIEDRSGTGKCQHRQRSDFDGQR